MITHPRGPPFFHPCTLLLHIPDQILLALTDLQQTQSLDKAAKDLLDAAQKWRLLPAGTKLDEAVPSLICGPVYLLRLYCRLPEILGRMGMPEKKTQLVVKYLESLMEYMEHEGKALFASA